MSDEREPLFPLGSLGMTPGARDFARDHSDNPAAFLASLVVRHQSGDWGTTDRHDRRANDAAVLDGSRIMSFYDVVCTAPGGCPRPGDHRVWVVTEAGRDRTTVLLPEDY